uniref:Uncharacterized protein n=1 Tax=Anguilla anguilla TaxID=7936 RepID=A0A0E9WGJ6_ANGAN
MKEKRCKKDFATLLPSLFKGKKERVDASCSDISYNIF